MAMQSPSSSSSSSSSSFSNEFTYQVFLSFRGIDTRHGFTGNLYKSLTDKGIHTFIDDKYLERGEEITPTLIKAIKESRIFIPVFSINYASSSFCLDELVHIIHCYKTRSRPVLPVFFGVDPTDLRNHTGSYGIALAEHEKKYENDKDNMERLKKWKTALTQAANLSGYHYDPHGYEYKFIEQIVKDISNKTDRVFLHVAQCPVGLHSLVQQVKSLLDKLSEDEVHMVGLYGAGGMGKSTLSKAIYNSIGDQFDELCFLGDVRTSNNLKDLQETLLLKTVKSNYKLGDVSEGINIIKQRLGRKKILLILDDVDKLEQLRALAGGLDWFGCGSRVIITTRDKHILTCHGIESMHAVEGLYGEEARQLFKLMAFKNGEVPTSYENILNRALTYASGLPLAIVTIGSNLFGKSVEDWGRLLDEYKKIPNKDIQRILRVSYDALDDKDQRVFLDLACFFKRFEWTMVKEILHAHYGHCIETHVRVLAEKCLIDYSEDDVYVTLHDLIEDMGKEVVRKESRYKLGEHSRLWFRDDIVDVLEKNMGSASIEKIYLNYSTMKKEINWNGKAFEKMTNLKSLIIENGHFSRDPEYFPNSLIFCEWNGCSLKSLSSCIGNKEFNYMTILTLNNCRSLTHIPDVSGLRNLEKFSFRSCCSLITIHNSIGYLDKLEILDASDCIKLESFPPLQLPSLKELNLKWCFSLKSFPELLCKMTNIKMVVVYGTKIEEIPTSIQNLSEISCLVFWSDKKHWLLKDLEDNNNNNNNDKMNSSQNVVLSKVGHLDLTCGRFSDECLQMLLNWCLNVTRVDLSLTNLKILPECLRECHHLRDLKLDNCKFLEEIRGFPPNLEEFSAKWCYSLSSLSRRMLLSEDTHWKLHEAGYKMFSLQTGTEGIPDWFEIQSRGHTTISFRFRKKIPSINVIILWEGRHATHEVKFYVNHFPWDLSEGQLYRKADLEKHAILFDLKLKEVGLEYEWTPVMLKLKKKYEYTKHRNVQIGIHVWKEKNNTEEDVIFTNPYSSDTEDYLASRDVENHTELDFSISHYSDTEEDDDSSDDESNMEVSETKFVQRQSLEAFATETVDFAQMGIQEESNTEEEQDVILTNHYSSDTKSDQDKNLEVSETRTVERRNLEETISETVTVQRQRLEESVSETEHGRCDVHCMTLLFEQIASLFARRETAEKCAGRKEEEKQTKHQG